MDQKSPDAFRTISEVAEWLGVPTHVLRFWESRFTQVKPVKRAGGRRYYRPADMELLGGIRKLLHDDGLTIRGVQKLLREEGVKHVAAMSPPLDFSAEAKDVTPSNVVPLHGAQAEEADTPELADMIEEAVTESLEETVHEAVENGFAGVVEKPEIVEMVEETIADDLFSTGFSHDEDEGSDIEAEPLAAPEPDTGILDEDEPALASPDEVMIEAIADEALGIEPDAEPVAEPTDETEFVEKTEPEVIAAEPVEEDAGPPAPEPEPEPSPALAMPEIGDDPADDAYEITPLAPRLRAARAARQAMAPTSLQALADRLVALAQDMDRMQAGHGHH